MKPERLFFEITMQGVKFKEFKDLRILSSIHTWELTYSITEFWNQKGPYRSFDDETLINKVSNHI